MICYLPVGKLAIFRFTKDFSKDYKYTVGESIKKETIELLIESNTNETLTKGLPQGWRTE